MRSETELIKEYNQLYQRALAVGITLKIEDECFRFYDIPGSRGIVSINSLQSLRNFIYGYELGYKSGLKPGVYNG